MTLSAQNNCSSRIASPISRRTALRLAFAAIPAAGALALPRFTQQAAAAGAPAIEIIDAVYQTMPGTVRPDQTNTGPRNRTALTKYNGNLILTTPGQVVQNLDISGIVDFRASNCTLRNCIVRGGPDPKPGTNSTYPLIKVWTTGVTGTLIEDVEIAASHPSVNVYGIHGFDFTARRVNIHGVVDGIVAFKQNVLVESCYIWDSRWYAYDPRQTDGAHNDLIQVEGGTNLRFIGNHFDARPAAGQTRGGNFCIFVSQNHARMNGLRISQNWFSGGSSASVQGKDNGKGAWLDVQIRDNRFTRSTNSATPTYSNATQGWALLLPASTYPVAGLANNVYLDNNQPARMKAI